MKALYYDGFQKLPVIAKVKDPVAGSHGVVVKVEASGLCRSDWHGWMGHDKDIRLPHVPGHEFAGTIVELGSKIKNWKVGDRVTVPFVCACGACPECDSGNQQVCRNQSQAGFTHWGSFAEYVAIDYAEINLVKLQDSMSFEVAASLGCRFATSFRAIVDQANVKSNQWVAVHGCGGVGLSAIMIAKALNARVLAIDIKDEALELAQKCGAEYVINANKIKNVAEAIIEYSNGGVEVSIDALGNPGTFHNSIHCLKRRGKHLQIGIFPPANTLQQIPVDKIIAHELEILGSHGMQAHRYDKMLEMIEQGLLNPSMLIGKYISLEDAVQCLISMNDFTDAGMTIINKF